MKHIVLWGCLLCCTSCQMSDPATVITRLPPADTLHSRSIEIPKSVVLNPTNICITNNHLVVYSEGKDTLFDIFQLPACEWVGHGGLVGKGPSDFSLLERSLLLPSDSGFIVAVADRVVDVSIAQNRTRILRSRPLYNASVQHLFTNRLRPVNDSICFYINDAISDPDPMQFTLFNLNTLHFSRFSPWPSYWISGKIVPQTETSVFIGNPVAHPNGDRFAVFYVWFKRFRIFGADGTLLHDISVEEPPYGNQFTTDYSVPLRCYYDYPQATPDFIYVTCTNAEDSESRTYTELQVWDWDGLPVTRFMLDQNLALIALSEQEHKLYGVDGEGRLYVYDLPVTNEF